MESPTATRPLWPWGRGEISGSTYTGTIRTSSDGVTWTARTSGTGYELNGVTYGNSTFVVVGTIGTILQSGSTATAATTPTPVASPTPVVAPSPTPIVTPGRTSSISGRVADTDGNPLKDVKVVLTGTGVLEDTVTDEEGFYQFQGLVKGDYILTCTKVGYRLDQTNASLDEGEEREMTTYYLEVAVAQITGYVVDIKGNPVASAKAQVLGLNTKVSRRAATDGDGFYKFTDLDADTYKLTVTKKGYQRYKQEVTLKEGIWLEIETTLHKTKKKAGVFHVLGAGGYELGNRE